MAPQPLLATNHVSAPQAFSPRKSYVISNTTETAAQLARNDHGIILRNALIDTALPVKLDIPPALRAKGAPGSYIVQSDRAIDNQFHDEVTKAGATFVNYLPNNAALVEATPAQAKAMLNDPEFQAVLPYEPYYKLGGSLLPVAVEQALAQPGTVSTAGDPAQSQDRELRVTTFPGQRDAAMKELAGLGANLIGEDNTPFGPTLIVKAPSQSLVEIAQSPLAWEIEPYVHRRALNDLTRVAMGVATDTLITTTNYLGLTGSNIIVNLNDTGVDSTLDDFTPNRVFSDTFSQSLGGLIDYDGHGTHVAGIIAGGGNDSATVSNEPPGSVAGADFRGKASQASLYVQVIDLLAGPIVSDSFLVSNASVTMTTAATQKGSSVTNGFISNNSWGYQDTVYDMSAASYDAATRDAQPGTPGEQSMLFVFAAGNAGGGSGNGIDGLAGTVSSPGTAKNIITVGAVDSPRNITNEVNIPLDMLSNDPIWQAETDNSNLVAYFSSCGPVSAGVEGQFGRFKPDVVAPGVFIVSDRAKNFVDPSAQQTLDYNNFPNQLVLPHRTNSVGITVPSDSQFLIIQLVANAQSPSPFPPLPILFDQNNPPQTQVGAGTVPATVTNLTGGTYYVGVYNSTGQPVAYDMNVYLVETNSLGDYYTVFSNLDATIGPHYRFETGTSMAAGAVSGILALMQQFLTTQMHIQPSPALLKALMINGSRRLGSLYDFNTQPNGPNSQGWGMPNLSNSIPASMASNNASLLFVDQSPSNALATGQSQTYTVNVSDPLALNSPLRITLVWTDPPADPAAGIALVNDLDLVVTDSTGTNVYIGNNFRGGDTFTEISGPTNLAVSDNVNNVENVYIDTSIMPLLPPYTITVKGTRVNVNAVTTQTNDIKQDYALVISSDDPTLASPLTLTSNAIVSNPGLLITSANSGVPLSHQRVGANEPNLYNYPSQTNGNFVQWHFFVFRNDQYSATNQASNVVIATFLPPNLSTPRTAGADIDLYSSTDPGLLLLNPISLQNAQKSLNRGGNETIFYSNSQPNTVYYVGVKSEDQQAADFTFFALAQQAPFASQQGGAVIANGVDLPMNIPDGSFDAPGVTNVLIFVPPSGSSTIARHVSVGPTAGGGFGLQVPHRNPGDLVGILTHPGYGSGTGATLHNHTGSPPGIFANFDDAPENPSIATTRSDGPGSLKSFIGVPFFGQWNLQETDNSLGQTGFVYNVTLRIDPVPPNSGSFTITIPANGWYYGFTNLPNDATNLNIGVGFGAAGPVSIYITNSPDVGPGDYGVSNIIAPGGSLNLSITNTPPLTGGLWYYGIYNGGTTPLTLNVVITVSENLTPNLVETLTNNTPIQLQTDAHTQSQICVTNTATLVNINVGVRIDDTNDLDNLVLHLTSPQGTSVLLFENRGGTNAGGLGFGETASNYVYTIFTEDTNLAGGSNLIKFAHPQYATSNYTRPTNIFLTGFEEAPSGIYTNGQTFSGWRVLTNEVQVVSNAALAHGGSNYLALGSGSIVTNLATIPGATYELQFVTRGPGITDWWPADGNTHDIIGTNNAILTTNTSFVQGLVGRAFNFTNAINAINVNTNVGNFGTNDFTVEFWARLESATPIRQALMSKSGACGCAQNFWDIATTTNASGSVGANPDLSGDTCTGNVGVVGGDISDGLFHHVAMVRSSTSLSIYTDGVLSSSVLASPANLNNASMFAFGADPCIAAGQMSVPNGQLDEISFYNRSLSAAEIYSIYHAGGTGKETPVSVLPNVRINVGNLITNIFTNGAALVTNVYVAGTSSNTIVDNSAVWETNAITFVASNTVTSIEIVGNALGRLFDDFTLTRFPVTNYNNYYLPEESLAPFTGENPGGCWTLDVWDTRTDSSLPNNGVLLGWNMQMTFSSTNVNLIVLTNRVPYTNTVTNIVADNGLASNFVYFAFDVPAQASYSTNILIKANPNVNVFFNQSALPTGALPGDVLLVSGNSGSYTLARNGPLPVLLPGQRYFLGVQFPSTPETFAIEVAADVTTNLVITPLSNNVAVVTNIIATNAAQYFSFTVPPAAYSASFEIINPTNEVDLYARHDLPVPTPSSYDYTAGYAGTNNETIVVTTNSQPVPLTPGTWYLSTYNANATNTVYYTIVASYQTNAPVIIVLTNGLNPPGSNVFTAPPGPDTQTFYSYTVPTNSTVVTNLQFVVTNLSGDVDLLAQVGAFPTSQDAAAGSFNPGTQDEVINLSPGTSLPTLQGTWYLAVPNNQNNNVTFQILVTTNTATAAPLQFSQVTVSNGQITLCWNANPGQQYTVEESTDLLNWTPVYSIPPGSPCFTTTINQGSGAVFYRLVSP